MFKKANYTLPLALVIMLAAGYATLFYKLGALAMRSYDEARNAIHTIEMVASGNYLIRTVDGLPDMWETKPPLLIWLQVACTQVFGYDEWVLRLPSAMAALATGLLIFWFLYKQTGKIFPGLVAALVLFTSPGYLLDHCARSANHDAVLIFFEIATLISFYNYLKGQKQALAWAAVCFTLGVLTKSIAIFFIGPGMLLWVLLAGKARMVFSNKRLYLYGALAVLPVAAYYLAREHYNPGYLRAVSDNELFARYTNTAQTYSYNKIESFWQYGQLLAKDLFMPWAYLLPLALFGLYYKRKDEGYKPGLYFLTGAVCFYTIASFGTYNSWYILPVVPMLAVVIGLGMHSCVAMLWAGEKALKRVLAALLTCAAIFFSFWGYSLSLRQFEIKPDYSPYLYAYVFKQLKEQQPHITTFTTFDTQSCEYNGSLKFYIILYTKIYGYHITEVCGENNLKPNTLAVSAHRNQQERIEKAYHSTIVAQHDGCILYRLGNARAD